MLPGVHTLYCRWISWIPRFYWKVQKPDDLLFNRNNNKKKNQKFRTHKMYVCVCVCMWAPKLHNDTKEKENTSGFPFVYVPNVIYPPFHARGYSNMVFFSFTSNIGCFIHNDHIAGNFYRRRRLCLQPAPPFSGFIILYYIPIGRYLYVCVQHCIHIIYIYIYCSSLPSFNLFLRHSNESGNCLLIN